jgi:choline dehydrogenase-like flavoprotein
MISDFLALKNNEDLTADICIIGAGAAGMAIAESFLDKNVKVLIIESGNFKFDQDIQNYYEIENVGLKYNGGFGGRFRTMGGSTTKWGGQALPLTELDFKPKSWINNSGWPIKKKDLDPYYKKALKFLNVDDIDFDDQIFKKLKIKPLDFDSVFSYHVSKWSPNPDLRNVYKKQFEDSRNLEILLNTNLLKIRLSDNRKDVNSIIAGDASAQIKITAKYYILSCGGIENARIMLHNAIATASPVGKYLQDHPSIEIGKLNPISSREMQRYFNIHYWQRWEYSIRLSLTDKFQENEKCTNASVSVMFTPHASSFIGRLNLLKKSIAEKKPFKILKNGVAALFKSYELLPIAYYYIFYKFQYKPGAYFPIKISFEQEPSEDSWVKLSDKKSDALGIPLSKINWDITEATWATTIKVAEKISEELKKHNLGEVELYPEISAENPHWKELFGDVNHHIGTTRMGTHPLKSVVDSDCKVWGLDNLYIAGSSVFPTSGHSNPTLTLIALSYRLAEYLNKKINEKAGDHHNPSDTVLRSNV